MKLLYGIFFYAFTTYNGTNMVDKQHPIRRDCEVYLMITDTLIQQYRCDLYREFKVEKKHGKYWVGTHWYYEVDLPDVRIYEIVDEHSVLRVQYVVEEI